MNYLARFLLAVLAVVPFGAGAANIPTTRGNNLTAYNGASASTNNNNWNTLMNSRTGVDTAELPTADFGNCNAVIMRCAQPKCSGGGCTDMSITYTIVSGCVKSNESCAKYGDELIQYISAQLVASSTAKANQAANEASIAAASAAAEQSAQQMAQMQMQMQQMQSEMAAQNAQTVAQLQSALEEQKELTAQAIAEANAARTTTVSATTADSGAVATQQQTVTGALTTAQQMAAQNGVSADVLAREQISGQIMSSIENAEKQLKELKVAMKDTFDYAHCDSKGSNCSGPKRVKMFKQKAMDFFEPYENVLDELYDALITAQAVGVDITDIYMMLNDSCNVWGQYLCAGNNTYRALTRFVDGKETQIDGYVWPTYNKNNCPNGVSNNSDGLARGGHACYINQVIPAEDDVTCTLQKTLTSKDEVQRNWLWEETGDMGGNIRVGCASSALEQSKFFRNRKKGSSIDIEVLERIIEQDAPSVYGSSWSGQKATEPRPDGVKFCAVSYETIGELEKIASLKTLPQTVCVPDKELEKILDKNGIIGDETEEQGKSTGQGRSGLKDLDVGVLFKTQAERNCNGKWNNTLKMCECKSGWWWDEGEQKCISIDSYIPSDEEINCMNTGGNWTGRECRCAYGTQSKDKKTCILPDEDF